MRIRIIITALLLVILLGACQGKPTVEPSVVQTPTQEAYPGISPTQVMDPVQSRGSETYPAPEEGAYVSWERATYHVQNGQISKVITTDAPNLTLVTKDGRTFYTIEPSTGAIDELVKQCGDPCKSITIE